MFRQPPPPASTDEMAAFVARAASPAPALAVVPNEPSEAPTSEPAPKRKRSAATEKGVLTKSATIAIPMPPANAEGGWRSKVVRRVDGRELRKQTFYLDAGTSQRLAVHCAKYHYEQSKAVERAVLALLEACGD
jgi:hypothetical protein